MKQRGFTPQSRQKALAIVRTFETGSPLGDHTAVAVLDDGAGVSYGSSQFTHRSGALQAVIDEYLRTGGAVGRRVFDDRYTTLCRRDRAAIRTLSADSGFRAALKAAGMTSEMRAAQAAVAERHYLRPAIDFCEAAGFVLPLSLAVVFDSLTHGSFEKIRGRVVSQMDPVAEGTSSEKAWITEYVRRRDQWLGSIHRLRATRYRTHFFLEQIMIGNWDLQLPLAVHGARITEDLFAGVQSSRVPGPGFSLQKQQAEAFALITEPQPADAWGINTQLDTIEARVDNAARTYDRIERIATTVITRTDRAKSLWTAIAGSAFQVLWGLFGFVAGLPREVWFFTGGVAAALTLMYLYRQVVLGTIREKALPEK